MTKRLSRPLAALLLTLAAPWATAGLLGTTATVGYHYNDFNYTQSLLVGVGVEVTCPGSFAMCGALSAPTQTVDLGDNDIRYQYNSATGDSAGFGGPVQVASYFVFDNLQTDTDIIGFSLTTDIAGLDRSRVSFRADSVHVDMWGLGLGTGGGFRINLLTAAQGVPEPASAALAALALVGLALTRRRG